MSSARTTCGKLPLVVMGPGRFGAVDVHYFAEGLLGVTLVPSDEAMRTYQDRIVTHGMEIEDNDDP